MPKKSFFRSKRFYGIALVFVVIIVLVGRPAFHLTKTIWNDVDEIHAEPNGTVNDASRQNQTPVAETWKVPSDAATAEQQLAQLLHRARTNHLHVSIAGARHSMGGHTISKDGIVIDMLPFNRMELNEANNILHVQSGARWSDVIRYLNERGRSPKIMQSNDDFSVGGSISVNCHGWQFGCPPIASSVESFRIMKADGEIVKCSRTENRELFSLALGGYGLFGIILDVDLHVVGNETYKMERLPTSSARFAELLNEKTSHATNVAMVYGRLRVTREKFLGEGILNILYRQPATNRVVTTFAKPKNATLKRAVFRGSADSDYGKALRWTAERNWDAHLSGDTFDRNALLYQPVSLFQNRRADSVDILIECFVPPAEFEPFLADLRTLIPQHKLDLLNVTVRHVNKDEDSFLRYASDERLALVMLFNQKRDAAGEERMAIGTREIIGATLRHGGTYYLPYRLHATEEQFAAGYPQANRFFELKRKYDPDELFQNEFYRKYGQSNL
jgi:FAD/FMN-containing dehydrogenase